MAADATQPVSRLALLGAAERKMVLADFNATGAAFPRGKLVHQQFEEQVAARPDASALVYQERSSSYAELNARANQLAHHLLALGVAPDERVALLAERGPEMIIGLLGILKAGAAYVPLDPAHPAERLAYMLDDCAPRALLTEQRLASILVHATLPTLLLDDADDMLALQPQHNPDPARSGLTDANLAYVMYTSGSTGLPKAVMIEHANVLNLLHDWQARCGLAHDAAPESALWSSFGFDVSVFEIFAPLSVGGTLNVAPESVRSDAALLLDWLGSHRIELAYLPPYFVRYLNEVADADIARLNLKAVLVGVEALVESELLRLESLLPSLSILNAYGPTEATVYCTVYQAFGPVARTAPIGRPIANARVYLLDRHLQPVPVGVAHELYIGGAGVARGYLHRPELSAERFVADPFAAEAGARMYKTGDVARWLADGNIAFIGRNDFQVKLRGYRIELGEIEARLLACDGVRDALVLAREDQPGDQRLVAYLVAVDGVQLDPAALRSRLAGQAWPTTWCRRLS
ncbi:amino acid adenylation domain-containing protein [Massilia sp. B-10]|nr:amino acid adenylation domain-containing protein [Massilia sp. B-10]